MSEGSLEQRVARLEGLVEGLLHQRRNGPGPHDWERTVGMFRGDPIMAEIIAEGARLREQEREESRRKEDESSDP